MSRPSLGRFIAGDPLRGLAAMAVVLFHISLFTALASPDRDPDGVLIRLFLGLDLGVYVFFVLSGYLLSRPFISAHHRGEPPPALGRYFTNRLLRIVPAFWFVCLVALIVFGRDGSSWTEVAGVFAFAQTWVEPAGFPEVMLQGWTLGAELLFYVVLPLAAILLARLPRAAIVVAIAVATAAVLAWRLRGSGADDFQHIPPTMLFAFTPGIALAAVEVLWSDRLLPRSAALPITLAGLALAALYALLDGAGVTTRVLLGTISCALIVAGPLLLEHTGGGAWKPLDNPVMHWLGTRSYSVYLMHVPVLVAVDFAYDNDMGLWSSWALTAAVTLPLTLLLAELTYRFVELPFLRLRTRGLVRSRPELRTADPSRPV